MTPEAQRIAIAEACGWADGDGKSNWPHYGYGPNSKPYPESPEKIPDYLNDLNAMHEAEEALTHDQLLRYHGFLLNICGERCHPLMASAPHRAEAFLKTINKWETK